MYVHKIFFLYSDPDPLYFRNEKVNTLELFFQPKYSTGSKKSTHTGFEGGERESYILVKKSRLFVTLNHFSHLKTFQLDLIF